MKDTTMTLNFKIEAAKTDRMPKGTMNKVFKALVAFNGAKEGEYFITGSNGIEYCFTVRIEKIAPKFYTYKLDVELTEEEGNTENDVYSLYSVEKYNGKFVYEDAYYEANRV